MFTESKKFDISFYEEVTIDEKELYCTNLSRNSNYFV